MREGSTPPKNLSEPWMRGEFRKKKEQLRLLMLLFEGECRMKSIVHKKKSGCIDREFTLN